MEKYSDQSKCKKCGAEKVTSTYFSGRSHGRGGVQVMPEQISRICQNCGFQWFELPLDSPYLQDLT